MYATSAYFTRAKGHYGARCCTVDKDRFRFRKPPLYPAELRDRAHRRQAPTDCGFLAGPGFNRYPCGRVETRGGIRPDLRIGLTGRVATARRDETGKFNP